MRDLMNKFGVVIIILCVAAAGAYLYMQHIRSSSGPMSEDRSLGFFVDEETGDESVQPISLIPPLPGKAGKPTVVRAIKYTTDGGKTSHVLYYSKYTEQAQKELTAMPGDDPAMDARRLELMSGGELIRSPDPGSSWVPSNSPQGDKLKVFPTGPEGKPAIFVNPRRR